MILALRNIMIESFKHTNQFYNSSMESRMVISSMKKHKQKVKNKNPKKIYFVNHFFFFASVGTKNKETIKLLLKSFSSHSSEIESQVEKYTPFKITSNSPIGLFLEKMIPHDEKSTSNSEYLFNSSQCLSEEEITLIENAAFLLGDLNNEDENSPRHKLKNTLRSHISFFTFKKYLENEHNSELIDLYLLVLKYKNIDAKDTRKKFDALRTIFHKYIDPNGKFNIGISIDNVEWFSSFMKNENDLSSYEHEYLNKLVEIIYADLRYSHTRFVEENDL
jgi:hypothetical protein